jgi:mannose/fructose/N-acetylgalactosamine-specific phosphotransferase system component IID
MDMSVRLSRLDLARVAFWNLLLQASYDTGRRQALGIAAAMASIRHVWPGSDDRRAFLLRHLEPMNTNPAMAGPLLGAMARLEEQAAIGDAEALARVSHMRRVLEGPLAATGDALFWAGLRPLAGLAGAIAAWQVGAAGPIAFVLIYNAVHLPIRIGGVFWGHAKAERVHELMRARWVKLLRFAIRWVIPLAGLCLVALGASINALPRWTVAPAAVVGVFLGSRSVVRGGFLAGGAIMVGLILSAVFARTIP